MTQLSVDELLNRATEARSRAYADYSGFAVGAALETETGEVFTGCNVENISYGLTLCAERVALGTAVAAGYRRFRRIVIVADTDEPVSPCGACRQVLAEFAPDLEILLFTLRGKHSRYTLTELLPRSKTGILNH